MPIAVQTAPEWQEGVYWCNSHSREATHINERKERCCDPRLGGILLPCRVILAPIKLEHDGVGDASEWLLYP